MKRSGLIVNTSTCKPRVFAEEFVSFVREWYGTKGVIPLHAPVFSGNEKKYVNEAIDSTFVSTVGEFVDRFETLVAGYTGAGHAVAAVNGTAALHMALILAGVKADDEVLTQPVTFVATCNAIHYCGAHPVFVDVDRDTLGLSAERLESFLQKQGERRAEGFVNRATGRVIRACVPVHTLGHPADVVAIREICDRFGLALVEDAAEALGSQYAGRHTGAFGQVGVFSFNGNKTITTGGGGMLVTRDAAVAQRARHLTTTAKVPHAWEYFHDAVGYNYRLPNLNAALGCAQVERLDEMLLEKRRLAEAYASFFEERGIQFVREPRGCRSNYWLNAILLEDREELDAVLRFTKEQGIMTRPLWRLMKELPMFEHCQADELPNAKWLADRLLTIPSGVRKEEKKLC